MRKLFFLLLSILVLGACNATFESAEPVGTAVWEGGTVPVRETDKEATDTPCVRCNIREQKKQLDAIEQDMLKNSGEVSSLPAYSQK